MFQTLKNAWKTQELKTKLLFTLLIVILYRLGASIPVPFVSSAIHSANFLQSAGYAFQLIAGDAFGQATLFALSVSPYITSSIIMQLLTIAIPALERMAKDGEEGKKKIGMITRFVTVALALVTAIGYTNLLDSYKYLEFGDVNKTFGKIVMIACYCAGASLVMWLAERINEFGIGNGISIILFANIVSRFPNTFVGLYNMIRYSKGAGQLISSIIWAVFIVALLLVIYWLIVWFTDSERRIPVQYAKRVVGRKMYGGQSSNLPIKLNMTGVMPVIFASSIVSLAPTILMLCGVNSTDDTFWGRFSKFIGQDGFVYPIVFFILIVGFAYFYTQITFDPVDVANNLKKQGGAIPGIRQGRPTSDYIKKILNKITLAGALFLSIIAVLPIIAGPHVIQHIIEWIIGGYYADAATRTQYAAIITAYAKQYSSVFTFGGTSLIIVVGVALETFRELEAQLTMRNYKGFL